MQLTDDDLVRLISPAYLARGRHYHRIGRVLDTTMTSDGRRILGRVRGTRPEPYEVSVEVESRDGHPLLDGYCTCPMAYNCKHVAAVLMEALERARRAPGAGALSGVVHRWLDQLEHAGQAPATPVPERLLYILDLEHGLPARVQVRPVVVRLLKAGGYGKERPFSLQGLAGGSVARFISPADQPILRALAARPFYARGWLEGDLGAELLARMVATGRAHWRAKDAPPLETGDARPGRPEWQTDPRGACRLALAVEPPGEVLPLVPPWYVDQARGLVGPLSVDLPPALAAQIAQAPPVPAEDLPAVSDWLAHRLPALPQPPGLSVRDLGRIEPRPVLDLCTRRFPNPLFFQAGAPTHVEVDLARLLFDYEGERLARGEGPPVFRRRRGEEVLRIHRDPGAEDRARERLEVLGLTELGELLGPAVPPDEARHLGLPDLGAWSRLVLEDLPRLEAEGWTVEVDESFRHRFVAPGQWYAEVDEGSGLDWFGLSLGVDVEGQRVNLLEPLARLLSDLPPGGRQEWVQSLLAGQRLLVTLADGRLMPLPTERVAALLELLVELYDGPLADGSLALPRNQATRLLELDGALEDLRWQGGDGMRALAARLREPPAPVTPPRALLAELRPYQREGLAWLQRQAGETLGALLADDMGLGKTVQTLGHVLTEREHGRLDRPCLIVAPTSLLGNWRTEAGRFAPDLRVLLLHGPGRRVHFPSIPDHDLLLTSYPLLARDRESLAEHTYHLLVLDEAQVVKNPRTQAAQAVRALDARLRLCLTGTPMENHLGELWAQMDFLMPGLLGDARQFRRHYRRPIEHDGDQARQRRLARLVAPFMLRRTKDQVAAELPPRSEIIQSVELDGPQRDLYEGIRLAMEERVRREVAAKGLARSHIVILDALLKLRQVCCDPRLVKLEAAHKVKRSAKLELLMDLLPELVAEGRRVLLFSQFTTMLGLIEPLLAEAGLAHVKLTGRTRDRETPVRRFQAGEVPVFLISLKAGGTGLNLTAADTVIHYDPWWNPAVEDQASDRAHRIGQDKPVFVYKLYTEGTVEARIRELQARKRALTAGILDGGQGSTAWTEDDLSELFAPLE